MTNKNIITYGCRLNIYESEVMQKHMDEAGLKNCTKANNKKNNIDNANIIPHTH